MLFSLNPLRLFAQENDAVFFEHLTVADGLPHVSVYDIAQDRDGYLWFGTQGGLVKYDGLEMTVYTPDPNNPNSLSDAAVVSVHESRDGMLWLATLAGGLNKFDPNLTTFTRYRHNPADSTSLSSDNFIVGSNIYENEQGQLWLGTRGGGLNRFDRKAGNSPTIAAPPITPAPSAATASP
jgi:ligand-binding sensor domain-containing protein